MSDPLEGINEKLKRAHENILNLQAEVSSFFEKRKDPTRSDDNFQASYALTSHFQQNPAMPIRFSVLIGEITHHLRSCLDHIAWQLSDADYRRDHPNRIEFPIFFKEPIDKNEAARYNGKVKGIRSDSAVALIGSLQPYNRPEPLDDPIWIVHDMDKFDKHRELVITRIGFNLSVPPHLQELFTHYLSQDRVPIPSEVAREFQKYMQISPDIAFRQFGKRPHQPVVPCLFQLEDAIREVVGLFKTELRK